MRINTVLYYHVGPSSHQIGDLILPTFGNEYQNYDPKDDFIRCDHSNPQHPIYTHSVSRWIMLSRELLFEKIRIEKFPSKPSRFESVYACLSLDDLTSYMTRHPKRYYTQKYEVKLDDSSKPTHTGDYTLCSWKHGMNLADMEKVAEDYWIGANITSSEFLTLSPLRIVRII